MALRLRFVGRFALRVAAPCGALLASFVLPSGCMPAAAALQTGEHPYAAPVAEAARRFAIPEIWIWRVMHAESRGRAGAVSHAGAIGLMQIMPGTWASLTARHRLGSNPFDPRANILAGAAYLRAMGDRYGDIALMLAAYNAGPGRADAYASGRRGLPAETVAYVAKIAPELRRTDTVTGVAAAAAPPRLSPGWRDAALFAGQREYPDAGRPASTPEAAAPPPTPAAPLFVSVSTGRDR